MKSPNEPMPLQEYSCTIRPRYNEVDQMGYVYHGNYVAYCHEARTEFMRTFGLDDKSVEARGVMMPVIDMSLKYHRPTGYDEPLTLTVILREIPTTRLCFDFVITNSQGQKVCSAKSTVVFVDKTSRKPMRAPLWISSAFRPADSGLGGG